MTAAVGDGIPSAPGGTGPERRGEAGEPRGWEGYDAFISYATAADRALALALWDRLRRVGAGLPGRARRGRRRAQLRVYLDQRSTPASGRLPEELKRALDASRFLIVLASPQAADSVWTNLEIEWWRERGADRPILIVQTGGTLAWDGSAEDFAATSDAVPSALRGFYQQMPKWVDMRPYKRWWFIHPRLALRLPSAHNLVCQLAAPIYGEKVETILKEERRRRRGIGAMIAACLVMVLLAVGLVWKTGKDEVAVRERLAISRALAHRSDEEAARDPILAAKLGVAAYAMARIPESVNIMAEHMDRLRHVQWIRDHRMDGTVSFSAVAVGGNGLFAFSGHDGSTIEVWDATESRRLHLLTAPPAEDGPPGAAGEGWGDIAALAFSRDGRWLFAYQVGHGLRSWNLAKGGREGPRGARGGFAFAVAPDASLVAAPGGFDLGEDAGTVVAEPVSGNGLEIWDRAHGSVTTAPPMGPRLRIDDVAFTADGRRLLALARDVDRERWVLRAWDLQGRWWLPGEVTITAPDVVPIAFSPDARRIAVVRSGRVELVDTGTGARVGGAPLPTGCEGQEVRPTAGDRITVVGCADGRVLAFDLKSDVHTELFRHIEGVWEVAVTPDGDRVLSTDRRHLAVTAPARDHRYRRLPWGQGVDGIEWDGAGRLGVLDGDRILIYDPERAEPVDRSAPDAVAGPDGVRWRRLAFSPDGRHLTTIGDSGDHFRLVRWRRSPLTPVWQRTAEQLGARQLYEVAELSSGMVAVATDRGVRLLTRDGRPGALLESEGGLAADRHGRYLVTVPVSGYRASRKQAAVVEVRRLDEAGRLSTPLRLRFPGAHVVDAAMSPDGSTLLLFVTYWKFTADGATDGERSSGLELWDPAAGRRKAVIAERRLSHFSGWVTDGAASRLVWFAPEGIAFYHAGHAGPPAVWTSPWGGGGLITASGAPSGDRAVAATFEEATVWRLDPEHWRTVLCRLTDGGLSRSEWQEHMPGHGDPPRFCA